MPCKAPKHCLFGLHAPTAARPVDGPDAPPADDASFKPNTGAIAEPIEKTSGGEEESLGADEKLTSRYKQLRGPTRWGRGFGSLAGDVSDV